jgi:hypothetical protein
VTYRSDLEDVMTESTAEPRRIRAGDADRDRVVAALQAHREAGRLTAEEFEERMESALLARWLDELPALLADLPGEEAAAGAHRPDGPPWAGRTHGPHPHGPEAWPRRGWRGPPWFLFPLAPLLLVFVVVGSVAAVVHGHFPFPLIWLAVIALWWRPWAMWRRGHWRTWQRH